jgi:hypothetical protein
MVNGVYSEDHYRYKCHERGNQRGTCNVQLAATLVTRLPQIKILKRTVPFGTHMLGITRVSLDTLTPVSFYFKRIITDEVQYHTYI